MSYTVRRLRWQMRLAVEKLVANKASESERNAVPREASSDFDVASTQPEHALGEKHAPPPTTDATDAWLYKKTAKPRKALPCNKVSL